MPYALVAMACFIYFINGSKMNIPIANKKDFVHNYHGKQYHDDYHWLKDTKILTTKTPEIISHLEAENKYTEEFFKDKKDLIDTLYKEMVGRVKLDDETVPVEIDGYKYFSRIKENQNYYAHYRINLNSKEELVLDENALAISDYLSVGAISVSNTHKFVAYSLDRVGNERYLLKIRDISANVDLEHEIDNVVDDIVWKSDDTGFYYVIPDEAWRPYKIMYYDLKSKLSHEIFHEKEETFRVSIAKSSDSEYLLIDVRSYTASEYYVTKLSEQNLTKIYDRSKNAIMYLDHGNNNFYALVNDVERNFRLVKITGDKLEDIISADKKVYLRDMALYDGAIAVHYRSNGLDYIKYSTDMGKSWNDIKFDQDSYSASIMPTYYKNTSIRYNYSSLNTPNEVRNFDFKKNEYSLLKFLEIPSGFKKEEYTVKREFAKSYDGTLVPVSVLYKTNLFKNNGENPLYLYGYGSYSISSDPKFNRNVISLVDRGYVYAIAHIRGGDEMGFDWYESAKFQTKKKTFEDFVSAAEHMASNNYTKPGNITIMGGSAGGMLVGAAMNMKPNLFKNVVAHVPFVDVINTMMDSTLPLTVNEYMEWGDPNKKDIFEYILSYAPYNNLNSVSYPNIYATTSLGDTRVAYWEPAKWIAKIREIKTNNPVILFETNMEAGHGGASGRFGYLKDKAKEYAFILGIE